MSAENSINKSYYGLGLNWWKQVIDSDCHKFGPLVFDEGKHGNDPEPGYLKGITEGSAYAAEALSANDLSVDLYKKIHEKTCSHFKEPVDFWGSGTTAKPGVFRDCAVHESMALSKWLTSEEKKKLD